MAVKTYSYSRDKSVKLSAHFVVGEFASVGNGTLYSDTIMIDTELVSALEKLFTKLNCKSITITSGYRNTECDKAVGGSGKGQHVLGKAADILCKGKDGKYIRSENVCCAAEDIGLYGIGRIGLYATHVDTRTATAKWWGDETHSGAPSITRINGSRSFYDYFGISKNPSTVLAVKEGANVKLKTGAKTYTGGKLASYVYGRVHRVQSISGDRAVITYGGAVVALVRVADLEVVS